MQMEATARHSISVLIAAMLTLALIPTLEASPAAAGSPKACRVTNGDSGSAFPHLKPAVKAAASGDHLLVKGTCGWVYVGKDMVIRGGFLDIRKDLVISGERTERVPRPVIGPFSVAAARTVTVRNVTVRGGVSQRTCGGGIWDRGDLTLLDVVVRANRARSGGGVCIDRRGTLTLAGRTRITHNSAVEQGGGVYNYGTLIMRDASRVSGNVAGGGGGVANEGSLVMNDASSITGNGGGGVVNWRRLTMNDTSTISGNTAEHGAGVYNWRRLTMSSASSITGNAATAGGGGVYDLFWTAETAHDASRTNNQPGFLPKSVLIGVNCAPQTYANVYGNTPDDCCFEP